MIPDKNINGKSDKDDSNNDSITMESNITGDNNKIYNLVAKEGSTVIFPNGRQRHKSNCKHIQKLTPLLKLIMVYFIKAVVISMIHLVCEMFEMILTEYIWFYLSI